MKKTLFTSLVCLLSFAVSLSAATFTVSNTNSSGSGSLQQAIFDGNTNLGADVISFNIPSGGLTIGLTNALPSIVEPVTIDGRSQVGFAGVPLIELNGASAGAAVDGLKIATSNCLISALVINRFLGDQIEITNGANNVVEGCYLGLSLTGLADASTGLNGILLTNSPGNTIGGLDATNRNYISGNNQSGVNLGGALSTNNFLLGNYIGLNVTNGAVVNSVDGVRVNAPRNLIGGSGTGARNLISGNTGQGIEITAAGIGTVVRGNYIGTDPSGTVDRGNSLDGILVNAGGVVIGGVNAGEGNLISGNGGDGIELNSLTATNNLVLGNIIGANVAATSALPNDDNGVLISTSSRSNIIGGVLAGEANLIAFNGIDGINVAAAVANTNNTFRGNSIFANGTVAGELGIDLGVSGITSNDSGDADTGANQLQNFPVLAWVTNTPTETIFSGILNSRPASTYVVDFYANTEVDTDGAGEGRYHLGATNLTTLADSDVTFTVALPVIALPGRYISATATDPFGNTSEFSTNVFAQSTTAGTTFTVVNTNDAGAGSLRQAILDANANISAGDLIAFAITNATTTINPASALPAIIDPVLIDGYTQPGSVTNSAAAAFNGTVLVTLSGASAGTGTDGLRFTVGNNTVRGLVLINFVGTAGDGLDFSGGGTNVITGNLIGIDQGGVDRGNGGDGIHFVNSPANIIGGVGAGDRNVISGNAGQGIDISGATSISNQISGNLIGTDLAGVADVGNASDGIAITTAGGNTVGGVAAAARNLISGNNGDGVAVASGGNATLIQNNRIGTDITGTLDLGNTGNGISFTAASNSLITANLISGNNGDGLELNGLNTSNHVVTVNLIGTDAIGSSAVPNAGNGVLITSNARFNRIGGVGTGNTIAYNSSDGVQIATGTNNSIRANSIFANGNLVTELGLDIGGDGITANDVGDADAGANQLQNFPVLTSAVNGVTGTTVTGTFSGATNRELVLDFYSSVAANLSGNGEGQTYLGSTNLTSDGDGLINFSAVLAVTNLAGRYLTATVTDTNGNTSEFSPAIMASSSLPGQTFTVVNTNDSGAGSLRQAVIDANAAITAGDVIAFAITNLSTTIRLASALPTIIDPVTIDGYTQPGAVTNSSALAFSGIVPIVLDGAAAGVNSDGLRFTSSGNEVRGLNIINFAQDGIEFSGSHSNVVEGCVIGVDGASVVRANLVDGVRLTSSAHNRIGGAAAGARNVISGNGDDGIEINGLAASNNVVAGNIIGLGLGGALDRGNGDGVVITAAPFNRIGGTNSTERNVISGNSFGILLQSPGASNNLVIGNFIGTDVQGTIDYGNSNEGIDVLSVPHNVLGAVGAGNLISGNGGDGIELSGAAAATNVVQANLIGTDITGSVALPNGNNGILISSSVGNRLGGLTGAEGNLISGNSSDGIEISGASAAGNELRNNRIGVTLATLAALPNIGNGVLVTSSAHHNLIGAGGGNLIGNNSADGVFVSSGTNNPIRANLIFANGDLGIDLGAAGVQENDATDADAGANQLQNYPVLLAVTNSAAQVDIAGTLAAAASTSYDLEFFANSTPEVSGNGEGQFFVGSTNVITDGGGQVEFLVSFATTLAGRYVSATATDPDGNTSEFSRWIPAASTIAPTNLVVTTTNDSGPGSLRDAITFANGFISSGNDMINFAIPGAGPHVIAPASSLPAITDPVTIDGYSQAGASVNTLCDVNNAVIQIQLQGTAAGNEADGLALNSLGGVLVRGLSIVGFAGDGIQLNAGVGDTIAGCFIGLAADGVTSLGNGLNGVFVASAATSGHRIGGGTAAERNLIAANTLSGVLVNFSASNLISGNLIGSDRSGTLDRGNGSSGVTLSGATAVANTIGGFTPCERNVISGNGSFTFADHFGINISGAKSNIVVGNFIGLAANGTATLGNGSSGVRLSGASFNVIGDGTIAGRNFISGNGNAGVELEFTSPTNTISGNFIGTDVTGLLDRGNTIYGVILAGASYNDVSGNVISGNDNDGVYVAGNASPGNRLTGNFIGVDATGINPLGNDGTGVRIEQSNTTVGGTNLADANIIAYNDSLGVYVSSGDTSCPILGNSIYANSSLGIDLNVNGVTANDLGDGDTGGNNLQNYPVLLEALRYPTETVIAATLNSQTGVTYRVEFFHNATNDPTGFGEGQTYLGFTNVTTDSSGNIAFSFTHPAALPLNSYFTATATDTNNNTSEFSAARRIVAFDSVDLAVSIVDSADPAPHATNFFYTISVTNAGPANATSVFVTNTLPVTASYVNAVASQGAATPAAGLVVWSVGNLNENAAATLTLELSSVVTDLATNSATVVAAQADNSPSNNSDSESTLLGIADLVVTFVDSPDPVVAGQTVTLTVTVTNLGPDIATATSLSLDLDQNFVVTSGAISPGTLNTFGNSFQGSLGNLAVNGSATLTVTALPMVEGTANNHFASVAAAESDPVATNSFVSTFTTVTPGSGVIEFTTGSAIVNEANTSITLSAQRLGGSIGTVTVAYATSNLTAVAGSDFTATTGTLTFTNGETLKTFAVPISNDVVAECNEAFTAHLLNPTGGALVLRTTNLVVLIYDNEVSSSGTVSAVSSTDTNLPPDSGNEDSYASSVSADGRYVVFSSDARNLVATDQNFATDVFVRDLLTETTALVSRRTGSSFSGSGPSASALISGNGRYVVFSSYASNFDDTDVNFGQDVFVRDLLFLTTTLISKNLSGSGSGNSTSFTSSPNRPLISSNGLTLVFSSYATDLTPEPDGNFDTDVFLYDQLNGTNRLISFSFAGGATSAGASTDPVISANGQVVAFESTATDVVNLPDFNGGGDVFVQDLAADTNELISVNLTGTATGSGISAMPYLNSDGRYVAFVSSAANLASNDANTRTDVFRRDRLTGTTVLVSGNTNGVAGNGFSTVHGISADGRYVLFASTSYDLVAGDYNFGEDIFVRDMLANVTVLVSRTPGGDVGNGASRNPVLSGDGSHVAFESYATDLTGATKFDYYTDIFVRNLTNQTMRLVSFRNGSTNGPNGDSFDAAISFQGNVTSFTGDAEGGGIESERIAINGSIEFSDIWAHRYASNTTELVSVTAPSATGNSFSYEPRINAGGTHIVFSSQAENLVAGDTNNATDVFLFNVTNGSITLVSLRTDNNGSGDGFSETPDLSDSARYIAFYSTSTNLVTGDTNDAGDIFRRDTLAGTTALVSVNSSGTGPGNSSSSHPDITPDGRFIVFETQATNLFANDLNGLIQDIVIRDMVSNVVELISRNATSTGSANDYSFFPVVSDDARFVAFETLATNLGPTDTNTRYDVYVRDRQSGTNLLCSRNLAGASGGDQDSYAAVLSGNGQIVLFYSVASDLVTGDTNETGDVFAFNTLTHTRQLVSVALGGGAGNGDSSTPAISADGRYVVFQSYATNLVANDSNGEISDIFVRDLLTGTTTLISTDCSALTGGNEGAFSPSISADGRYIAFQSTANNLIGGAYSIGADNLYRHDRLTGETVLVSQNRFITGGGNGNSFHASSSANGGAVAFVSGANNLVATDANNDEDIFVWQGNLVASGVDLVLTKTASTNVVAQSSGFSYTLTVTNYGSASATTVAVSDPLPIGLSFVSAVSSQGTVTNSSGTILATVGALAANAGASITINVTAVSAGSVSNYASAAAIETDATPANNFDSVVVSVTSFAPPALAIQQTNSTQIFVSWPAVTPSGFALETTTNLTPVIIWTSVTNSVSTTGTNKFVILDVNANEPERYYRLKQ